MAYNQEKVDRDLRENDITSSEFQKKVLDYVMAFVRTSADEMSKYYANWDNNDFVYRGYRSMDRDDKDSVAKGEPAKIIVPITYAQTQTALSFIFSTFTQKKVLYEMLARGPEDEGGKLAFETDIDYQMSYQKALFKLYCYLLDHFKYGFGVMKCDWTENYCDVRIGRQVPKMDLMSSIMKMFGQTKPQQFETVESVESILEYQGSRLANISPYSFYPDPSVTLAKFQDGKFVAHDEETSFADVSSDEGTEYHGTDKIPNTIPPDEMKGRKRRTGSTFKSSGAGEVPGPTEGKESAIRAVVKTEVMFVMSERKATETFGMDMGNGTKQIKWLVVIGNDKKIIQFKPAGYLHNQFNYCLSEFSPDSNSFYNPGLSDTIFELQNLITFFLNSHVVNVKKIIQNRFVGDPSKVNMADVTENAAFIRLTQSGLPIDKVLQQLQVTDATRGHVADISTLSQLLQMVTGINENALGQYNSGRRSATEARSVNAGAAARLKMLAQLIWLQGLEPLGKQVVSNTRQGRTKEVYDMIVGATAAEFPFERVILADPKKIAGGYDFMPYDATLPSDRGFQASIFQELMTTLIQNPNTLQLLNINPVKLLNHIAELYGIKNIKDYQLVPDQPLPPLESSVQPDAAVGEMVAAGQAEAVPDASTLLQSLAQG